MTRFLFTLPQTIGLDACSEANARQQALAALAPEHLSLERADLPEAVGPMPTTGSITTINGNPISLWAPPIFTLVWTDAAQKLIVGPPALNPAPEKVIAITGTSFTFKIPAYAVIYKVYEVQNASPKTYLVFLSIMKPDGNLEATSCWFADPTVTFYNSQTGGVNLGPNCVEVANAQVQNAGGGNE